MAPECQEKNAKGLTMVAIGMNKAADELMILDERTAEDLASGKYRDHRRGSFGTSTPAAGPAAAPRAVRSPTSAASGAVRSPGQQAGAARARSPRPSPSPAPARSWTARQERLALIYNEQGLRPDEIAQKLGVSVYTATQIILAARSHTKG